MNSTILFESYAGIGSRQTPVDVMTEMTSIASRLQDRYILNSGAAEGADKAFETGVTNGNKNIFLAWRGFNNNTSTLYNVTPAAIEIAKQFHSRWDQLSQGAQKLMSRNVYQVLGEDLTSPVSFVLCWSPDGCESHKTRNRLTGGTGQAISIADTHGIPVINMKNWDWKVRLNDVTGMDLYDF